MKLIVLDGRVIGTALDSYSGPQEFIEAPADFDLTKIEFYRVLDGALVLSQNRITRLQFRSLFTQDEKVSIYLAADASVQVRVFIDDVNTAEYIDIDNPDVIAGVQGLAAAGLITPERANEILGIQSAEETV